MFFAPQPTRALGTRAPRARPWYGATMSASRIANVAGTATASSRCDRARASTGCLRAITSSYVHAELTGQLPTSVLPPGWHLCPRLPGLHQAVLVPTEPSEHCVTALADTKPGRRGDCYRVEMASTLVVAPDVGQLASENSAALGGPQLVERAVGVVGRAALTTLAAACTAPELAAPGEPYASASASASAYSLSQSQSQNQKQSPNLSLSLSLTMTGAGAALLGPTPGRDCRVRVRVKVRVGMGVKVKVRIPAAAWITGVPTSSLITSNGPARALARAQTETKPDRCPCPCPSPGP